MIRRLQPLDDVLGKALPELTEPILFQNMLQKSDGSYEWKLLQWSLTEFVEKFGDKKLPFRVGDHNKRTCSLQHDHWCVSPPAKPIYLTMQEFTNLVKEDKPNNMWYYCDYKHIKEWFNDKTEIIESFNWLKFGIDEEFGKNGMYSTIWIGSKGAHTDCHWDTYGYNLVAQIHGRKQWLLYPPDAPLIPVRLPYEESTVYSRFNIYCLSEEEKECLLSIPNRPKLITLEPGDVLFVPNGWWHYVESLDELNVSVNIWGKLKTDSRARVEEALVKLIVAKMADYKQFRIKRSNYYTTEVECAIEHAQDEEKERRCKFLSTAMKRPKPMPSCASELAEEYPYYIKLLPDADDQKLKDFIEERRKRDKEKYPSEETTASGDYIPNPQYDSFFESLINALCHPEVISKAAKILLERHY
ncbi:HSPB1-associated protein 1 isoform X1 [Pogonomyrmex barbatus]|uniref:HSPB1-associated protein 1 isoform X1 n=2 Tax=Pogonomyrmex barbatus TaxID=144034 RepID=A0A6I9WND9_9HYME|nr:HSPB1-associated protein 1 isoform X1 [Pogonomyrmex barbatus]